MKEIAKSDTFNDCLELLMVFRYLLNSSFKGIVNEKESQNLCYFAHCSLVFIISEIGIATVCFHSGLCFISDFVPCTCFVVLGTVST